MRGLPEISRADPPGAQKSEALVVEARICGHSWSVAAAEAGRSVADLTAAKIAKRPPALLKRHVEVEDTFSEAD